jgi:hypothetical protein
VDAEAGTLTVNVRSKDDPSPKEEEFQLTDATKVTIYGADADAKRELTGKEGLKDLKEGTRVALVSANGKLSQLIVNPPRKKAGG